MSRVLAALDQHASQRSKACAVRGVQVSYSYSALASEVDTLARRIRQSEAQRVGLYLDNHPAWAVIDLALQAVSKPHVPLPAFFSDNQLQYAVANAGLDTLLTDNPQRLVRLFPAARTRPLPRAGGGNLWCLSLTVNTANSLPMHTAKITYTSGTTGTPKGVCLTQTAMDQVARSLMTRLDVMPGDQHLALLPLSILLENIGGLYTALLAGAATWLVSMESLGARGASGFDAGALANALRHYQPTSLITLPQILQLLVLLAEQGLQLPQLRFVAVGGAPVSPQLLARAQAAGLPVFEGYGLSECASVVAVNAPGQQRPGSVGKPLPHLEVHFATDGEILVRGNRFAGYLGETNRPSSQTWATGDIGYRDADGYLHITGRKKNMFITSFGRNVAPEWLERELTLHPAIAQGVVFGEGRPWPVAVIVPRNPATPADEIQAALDSINPHLPDYARIGGFVLAHAPFSVTNDQYTATGRPRRAAIWQHYGPYLEQLYPSAQAAMGITQ